MQIYLCSVVLLSVLSVGLYAWDKRQAGIQGRRVPEKTLHLLAFLGGWPGAWFAQRQFRHKTRKQPFRRTFFALAALHLLLLAGVLYWRG